MRFYVMVVVLAAAVFAFVLPSAFAGPAPVKCASLSVGPGALRRGVTGGPACLLRAFRQGCPSATSVLWRFGVDTVATETFRLVKRRGRCEVAVTVSFRVVPQPAHATGDGYCTTVGRRNGDVIVAGCSGVGLPATISLTGRDRVTAAYAGNRPAGGCVRSAQRLLIVRVGSAPQHHFRFPGRVIVVSSARATAALVSVCGLPRFPRGAVFHCPIDFTLRYRLTFDTLVGRLSFSADPYGCQMVSGHGFLRQARPGLWRSLGRAIGISDATDATFTGMF